MYHTEVTINEKFAFSKPSIASNSLGFERLECLFACLSAVKSWFEIWFQFPSSVYPSFNFLIFAQLVRCVIIINRLCVLDEPDWDKSLVDATANLSDIIDRLIASLREGGEYQVKTFGDDSFLQMAGIVEWVKAKHNDMLTPDLVTTMNMMGHSTDRGTNGQGDFIDDAWIRDILESWDYGLASAY